MSADNIIKYDFLEQGSEQWHSLRSEFLATASRTPIVLGLSPFSNIEKLAQEIKFGIKPFYSKAMQDGNDLEDKVRELANEYFDDVFVPTVGVNNDLLASLDGINFEEDTIIEIKVSEKTFEEVKRGNIPDHYLWQIKHQMQVFSSVERAFLIAYSKEKNEIAVSDPIVKDENFGNDFFIILDAWKKFYEFLENYELPKINNIDDIDALLLSDELYEINEKKKELEAREKEIKEKLKFFAIADKNVVGNLMITKTKGAKKIDYVKLINDKKVDVSDIEKYTSFNADSIVFRFNAKNK